MPNRRYARNHVWARLDGDAVLIGLSARALEQLGEITGFSLRARPGDELAGGQCFAALESDKAEVELFTPVGGAVVRVHEALELRPEVIGDDCYGDGWMLELRPGDLGEWNSLLDPVAYSELLKTATHRD